ncbi:hypothetical protein [Tenuifilum sp.]|uniref:hypothetical protein n=1 Tax=Tenuifilum sp. TaxID=2760880 RepID=UPI002C72011E|nr:hypothetical protein [Tenuifilum sp.]HQE54822.1 hypothetical protein [Tenuifilum sp.]HQI89434.1 hypothetical protein [Tenuifilum sp.]HRC94638.1 hypothetical protein [Tenuifilaceae bacterium]
MSKFHISKKKYKIKLTISLILVFFSLNSLAQVDLKMILRNPLPSEISEWVNDPSIFQIVITNMGNDEYPNCTAGFTITNEKGKVIASTKTGSRYLPRFTILKPPSVLILNGPQVLNMNAVEYDRSIERIALNTNALPEGNYQLCVSVYDYRGNNITIGGEYCMNIITQIPEPPTIISPSDNEIILSSIPIFRWMPLTNYNPRTVQPRYKIKVCPVFQGQTPRTAIEVNPILFEKSDITSTFYQSIPGDLPFDFYPQVTQYAWIVQAFDPSGKPIGGNQGRSEVATFRVGKDEQEFSIDNIYPVAGDTLPWAHPQLIAKISPFNSTVTQVALQLSVREDGSATIYTYPKVMSYSPRQFESPITPELAGVVVCNYSSGAIAPFMAALKQGKKYYWKVDATITTADGKTTTVNSRETSFAVGLSKAKSFKPAADTLMEIGNGVELSFEVNQPQQLNYPNYSLFNVPFFNGAYATTMATAKIKFEVSKKQSFDSLVYQSTITLPSTGHYSTGSDCPELYQRINHRISQLSDTGKYYWRVKFLDPIDDAYFTSQPASFRIVADSLTSCFTMNVDKPTNNGNWTENQTPTFAILIKPTIKKKHISGGRLRIWKMTSESQKLSDVIKEKPVFDESFTGNENNKIAELSTDINGYTRWDLPFINGDSNSKEFKGDDNTYYTWNFRLNYNKDSIRADGCKCKADSVISNQGVFQIKTSAKDENTCPGNCFAEAPTNTTPGTQTLAKDSTITIGNFTMKLISVSGTPESLSGEGSIEVPYLRAPILVEFSNIGVNGDNKVYQGEVYAKIDPAAPYSKADGNDFEGEVLNMADNQLKSIYEWSSSLGRLVSSLINTNPVTLPIGLDRNIEGNNTVVAIIAMKFTPTQAVLNAATWAELPLLGPDVGFGFGAKNLCFHKDGLGGMKRAELYLVHDFGYRSDESWSFLFKSPTPTDSGTYAKWDCKGLHYIEVKAEVEFPKTWLKMANPDDSLQNVKAHFAGRAEKNGNSWGWILNANMDDCEFTHLPGFKMKVNSMVFDYTTIQNPENITFPNGYTGDKTNTWKGFYIKNAEITLPDNLKTFDDANPKIQVSNLIIDGNGITGKLYAENLFQEFDGDFGGWGGSIDTLKAEIINNTLSNWRMRGRIKTSFTDTLFVYNGLYNRSINQDNNTISNDYNLELVVNTEHGYEREIPLSWLPLKMKIDPATSIKVTYNKKDVKAEANLNATLTFEGSNDILSKLDFKGIKVEGLTFRTYEPYVENGNWDFASPQHSMAGFPVNIDGVSSVTRFSNGAFGPGVRFNLNIGLQPGSNAVNGTTTLTFWSKLINDRGRQRFMFDGIELDSIGVNADLGAVKVRGGLNLFQSDATYGDGYRGVVTASFIDNITTSATAQFGMVNKFRYWYIDAKTILPTGLPVFPNFSMYGFGGGAWYKMHRSGTTNLAEQAFAPDSSKNPSKTNSGFTYVPDNSASLGLSAQVIMGTSPSAETFNGDFTLQAQFQNGGGLSSVSLLGNGYMLCSINERNKAKILADADINYTVSEQTLHGVFNARVDYQPLTGSGQMVMHFAPDLWYIKFGEPSKRMQLTFADWLRSDAYLMVGQQLPPPPALPAEIQQAFPGYTQSRSFMIEQGNGIALGASTGFNTGRQQYMIFYGDVAAQAGYDMAMLKYNGVTCEGRSGELGINGWYATGQVYAYLNASIGMHVDVWFTSGNFEILSLNTAAMLEAGLPNPTWIKGAIGGNYRILGGAVKGYCNYHFSMGDECQMLGDNPLARIDLISDISPVSGQNGVDVSIEAQVALNFKLNEPFQLKEMTNNGQTRIRTFRIKMDQFKIVNATNNDSIPGRLSIDPEGFSAYYKPFEMLEGHTNFKVLASVYGEELVNGVWRPATNQNGQVIKQQVTATFKTGSRPDRITEQNVAYSYPVIGHKYFLQDECRAGRVQLKSGQSYLFQPREGYNVQFIARFMPTDIALMPVDVPLTYNSSTNTLLFDIPNLINSKSYYIQFIRKEIPNDPNLQRMLDLGQQFLNSGGMQHSLTTNESNIYNRGGSQVNLVRRTINQNSNLNSGERLLYAVWFSTSRFNTLSQKLATFNHTSTSVETNGNFERLTANYQGEECFDEFDFRPITWVSSGTVNRFGPLVKINAWQRNSQWHNQFANPLVYDEIAWMQSNGYWNGPINYNQYMSDPSLSFVDIDFNTSMSVSVNAIGQPFGIGGTGGTGQSSTGAVALVQGGFSTSNQPQNLSLFQSSSAPYFKLTYNHGIIVPTDFMNLKYRAIATLSNPLITINAAKRNRLNAIINSNYQRMYRGTYPLSFYYDYFGCRVIDTEPVTISKPFIY